MIKSLKTNKKLYLSLFKAVIPGVLFLIVLFSMFFVSSNDKVITSLAKVFYGDNEIQLDNWEISTVFYDSTVNNGQTPLTEINWDASDGGYMQGQSRTIIVQINYKNANPIVTYEPNDLEIKIPNLINGCNYWTYEIFVGANDANHLGYDWSFKTQKIGNNSYNYPIISMSDFYFINNKTLEKSTNLEGTIQIVYTLTPRNEQQYIPKYEDSFNINYSKSLKSTLNEEINSNETSFQYNRNVISPWNYDKKSIVQTPSIIKSYDGLGQNAIDYTWIKYSYTVNGYFHVSTNPYPNIMDRYLTITGHLPENCIIYDGNLNQIELENNTFKIIIDNYSSRYYSNSYYIGYPKNIYNESNPLIENEVVLYGMYDDDVELYQDNDIQSLNINNYQFNYTGENYSIKKSLDSYIGSISQKTYYESLVGEDTQIGNKGNLVVKFNNVARYTANPITVVYGDDLIYIKDKNGNYRKMNDSEYYFSEIYWPKSFKNGNDVDIANGKYDCELWVRYRNSSSYELYDSFKNGEKDRWNFSSTTFVEAYYFKIKDMTESLYTSYLGVGNRANPDSYLVINNANNISESGLIYNFAYLKVYINGELQNVPNISSYSEFDSIGNISGYDLANHGSYIQRSADKEGYEKFVLSFKHYLGLEKTMTYKQNSTNECFDVTLSLSLPNTIDGNNPNSHIIQTYSNQIIEEKKLYGWEFYDILPEGMEPTSSYEDVINSFIPHSNEVYERIYDATAGYRLLNRIEYENIIKNNTTVEYIKNYKNSNRTYIKIVVDLSNHPLILIENSYNATYATFKVNTKISYDNYIEYGQTYSNYGYVKYHERTLGSNGFEQNLYGSSKITDNGYFDVIAYDIDQNGNSSESIIYKKKSITITSAISTNQDVQVSVQSDKSNFDIGKIDTSNDSEYYYKLRVRNGSNDVTNLVIYDSLEKYAKDSNMENVLSSGGRNSWYGEFLGIDTSYAESKGYTIRTYYSENDQPGSIHDDDDDSWQLYTDSVDKSKVKSLAFEYLDSSGNPAVLPANSLTYVLIRMKSPADEELKTLAYNGCWTEWNAIDPITGQTVDFITGINSNIVKVALPKSVEPVDIDLDIDKYWKDNNNSLGFRPDTINIQVVPNGDVTKAINVPLGTSNVVSGNSNHWKTSVSVPKYDEDGEVINYSLREGEIILDDGYKYTPSIEGNTITNTLMKEIELKKIWKDNTNSYLTRPTNVTYMVKLNGNDYKEVTFTGDYSTNEWIKKITVPVFDSSNNEYVYTVEEYNVDNYSSICNELVCTNTLSGIKNITITKEWNDKNNEYNTRPDSIKVNLLRNGNLYQEVTLSSNDWNSNNIEVPLYDENGVKYNYTISEDNVDEYGLVEYDQNSFKVTNSLKKKINLVIKKIWIDDNNSNNTRPSELQITLLRNNEEYQTVTLTGDTNEWTTSVEVDKYDSNFNKYKYSIKEVNDSISDLYSNVIYSEDELTVTNTLSQITNLTISKKWIDYDNEYLTRPDSVKVNLLQNGVLYREVTVSKNNNWKEIVSNVPVYDSNQNKYTYTIEESVSVSKYGKVTYDQTNLEVTNELTEVPTVSLYFTVVNGYVDPITGEMKYDDFGLNEIMKKYNVKAEDEYIFTFELKNLDSGKIYDGKLSTQGILEFKDIPYGEYKAVEGEDKLFNFVDMFSIEEVNGVSFRRVGNEGHISIRPTGENIIFGAKIVNKITLPMENPNTGVFVELFILLIVLLPIVYSLYFLSIKIKNG